MKTEHREKQEADTIRRLRDQGYTQKCVAEEMELHPTQVSRIAAKHGISFTQCRPVPNKEDGVYTLGISMSQWEQIGADVQHWCELIGNAFDAMNVVAQMYGIPPGAVKCWVEGEHHRLD